MGKYYLYRHIRLDKNEPFYIGIAVKQKNKGEYERANSRNNRNAYWHNVINKTGYEVEIIIESDDYEFIKKKEIEFIKLYGRADLKLGPLVNLTDGGEGQLGVKMSEIHKNKMISIHKGSKHTPKHIELAVKSRRKQTILYNLNMDIIGNFESLTKTAEHLNTVVGAISRFINKDKIYKNLYYIKYA